MRFLEETLRTPVAGSADVIVAGGGVAGVAAALSAARCGKRVLLVEKSLTLGGLATSGLINFFVPMCDGRGNQVVTGMAEELLRLSVSQGYDSLPREWRDGAPGHPTQERYVTAYSPCIFAMQLMRLLLDEGVTLLLDSDAALPVVRDGRVEALVLESKSGRECYECGFVIDATGDADLLYRAGVPTVTGKNYFTYIAETIDIEHCRRAASSGDIRDAFSSVCGGEASLYGQRHPEGMPLWEGVTARDITRYVAENQRIVLERLRRTPRGSRDVVMLPGVPQMRTTRRIDGEYTLTSDDAYRRFDDSVGLVCDFDRRDYLFEVPLRALANARVTNLVTCGRSASATGYAWDVLRVIPPAILTGQAAGQIAAHALDENVPALSVDVPALQKALTNAGVRLHAEP